MVVMLILEKTSRAYLVSIGYARLEIERWDVRLEINRRLRCQLSSNLLHAGSNIVNSNMVAQSGPCRHDVGPELAQIRDPAVDSHRKFSLHATTKQGAFLINRRHT